MQPRLVPWLDPDRRSRKADEPGYNKQDHRGWFGQVGQGLGPDQVRFKVLLSASTEHLERPIAQVWVRGGVSVHAPLMQPRGSTHPLLPPCSRRHAAETSLTSHRLLYLFLMTRWTPSHAYLTLPCVPCRCSYPPCRPFTSLSSCPGKRFDHRQV